MSLLLFKLAFDSAVHFGGAGSALSLEHSEMNFRADTLFSALCHAAFSLHGEHGVQMLCQWAKQGELLFSDAMPWQGDTLYLPKPLMASSSPSEIPPEQRKKIKRLAWLPVSEFDRYTRTLREGVYTPSQAACFGHYCEQIKAAVPSGCDAVPYPVGLYRFAENCGLYFICCCQSDAQASQLHLFLEALGLSGIGGKTSAGYGRFHFDEPIDLEKPFDKQTEWLKNALQAAAGPWLLLTTSLPREEEAENALQGASFQLMRRGGFAVSEQLTEGRKKQTQFYLQSGSVLQNRFNGDLYSVCPGAPHPVYRYAKPLFLRLDL